MAKGVVVGGVDVLGADEFRLLADCGFEGLAGCSRACPGRWLRRRIRGAPSLREGTWRRWAGGFRRCGRGSGRRTRRARSEPCLTTAFSMNWPGASICSRSMPSWTSAKPPRDLTLVKMRERPSTPSESLVISPRPECTLLSWSVTWPKDSVRRSCSGGVELFVDGDAHLFELGGVVFVELGRGDLRRRCGA